MAPLVVWTVTTWDPAIGKLTLQVSPVEVAVVEVSSSHLLNVPNEAYVNSELGIDVPTKVREL